jgi:trimeric autotransporter adhesin
MTPGEQDPATAKIRQLRGVTWEWREEAPAEAKQQPGMGVIAQDVERVFPQLVETDEQGYKRVDYNGLIAPLIEAVKELDDRLRAVEAHLGQQDEQSGQQY